MEIYMNRIHSNYCVGAARGGAAGGWNLSVGRWLEHVATGMRKWVDEIGEREKGKGKPKTGGHGGSIYTLQSEKKRRDGGEPKRIV